MSKYTFIRNGIEEEVNAEKWRWIAIYSDGEVLKQFDDENHFHQFKEIDQSKLAVFRMLKDDTSMNYDLIFNSADMKLIHFYRHTQLENGAIKLKCYVFGYEKNINGVTVKSLQMIMPDDKLITADDLDNIAIGVT
jgi:hypothetical protein